MIPQVSAMSALVRALLSAAVLAAPFAAWVLAALAVGPGPGSRWRRAPRVVGQAALVMLGIVLLLRIVGWASDDLQGGPLGWVRALDQALAGAPTGRAFLPLDAVLLLAMPLAAIVVIASPVLALATRRRARQQFRVPMADGMGLFLALAAIAAVVIAQGAYLQDRPNRMFLDGAAALPLFCMAIAVWTRLEQAAPGVAAAPLPAPRAVPVAADVPALWRAAGALDTATQPLASSPGRLGAPTSGWGAWAWGASGALGPPPRSLEAISAAWATPGSAWLVGDLPNPTERHLLVASVLLATLRDALPTVVVTEDAPALRDAVARALRASGHWMPGALPAGAQELREALAAGRMPAAVFLDLAQLSSAAIRALATAKDGYARAWCRSVGLVLVSRVDCGAPLDVTHRMFTLRRLDLVLDAAGARFSVLATGVGGAGTRSLVDRMFRTVSTRDVPLEPRVAAPVQVWPVSERFRELPGVPWVRRAVEPLVAVGLRTSVGDPVGSFDAQAADVWGADVQFSRDVCFDGDASVSALDEGWVVAAYRALGNRVPLPSGAPHHALWGMAQNPVVRFLARDRNLENLARTGQLPPPSPVVGYENASIATAHLKAAVQEAEQDLESLHALFGKSRVEQVLGKAEGSRWALRVGRDGAFHRAPVVPAGRVEASNPLRTTVTEDAVKVIDGHGRTLTLVDRLMVTTRFYPGRVFSAGNARYEVPLQSYDEKRGELRVQLAADKPLTRPQLRSRFENVTLAESVQTVRGERATFQVCSADATVLETVSGHYAIGRSGRVDLAPVAAQYRTRLRAILFPADASSNVLYHLARSVDGVLIAHLLTSDEDIEVAPVARGELFPQAPGGIVVIDRHVQGMGVAEALDLPTIESVLKWVRAILGTCKCPRGCAECTPDLVLDVGPDKTGVLRLLG